MSHSSGSQYKYAPDQYGKSYDNKAYAASQNPVYQDDQHYHEHQDFSRKKSGRGKFLIIGLVCFILLAAAIAIGVYFGVRSTSDDDEPDVAATVQMTVRLDETWNDELDDPTSQAYMDKKKEVEEGIDKLMLDVGGYKGSTVTGFSPGSIDADVNSKFKNNEIMDGNQKKALTAEVVKDIFKKKVAAQKALNNAFAAKIIAEAITAELKTGAVGNVDLGKRCSMDKDCEDRNTECSDSPKICKCNTNFYNANTKDNGGSCRPTKDYGSQCTIDRQCAFGGGQCKDRKCGCSGDKFRKNNQCNDKIDIDRPGCDADSECKYTGAECNLRACRCPTDTYKGNLKCLAKIGIDKEGCSQDGDCKYGKCISSFCRCPDNKVFDMDGCKDPAVLETCIEPMSQHEDCKHFASTLLVEHKFTQVQICAVAHLITRELIPRCIRQHNLPDECSSNIPEIWEELLKRGKMEYKMKETELDDCDEYVVDKCAVQDLNAVIRCYGEFAHMENPGCRLVNCIEMATNTYCPSKKLNKVKMYKLAKEIYEEIPVCRLQACGVQAFARMAADNCAGVWNVWEKTKDVMEKCNAFEAFLGCVGTQYLGNGIDHCGFEVLSNNMSSQAQENDYEKPSICAGTTHTQLDQQFPTTIAGICDNTFIFRSIIIYFCPASEVIFNTTEERDLCMTEIGRKACLYLIVKVIGCSAEAVYAKLATPDVRKDIFPFTGNCESTYPCVTQTMRSDLISSCVTPVTQYVSLSLFGVDVDGATAMNSQDKLKCSMWNIATGCARTVVTTCTDSDEMRDGMRIMMHMGLAPYPELNSKLDIFDGCPAFPSTSFDPCPNDEEFLYVIIPHCVLEALRLKAVGHDEHDIACGHLLKCAQDIANYLQSILNCPNAVESFRKMASDENRAFLKRVTKLDCPRAGSCPSVGEGQDGNCVNQCKDDTECTGGINKCCFNGCGHTCQAPNMD